MKHEKSRNSYYMLPFIFGLLGLVYQWRRRRNEAIGLLALFLITGLGIIVYSNQPPNEPRERDYVLIGSFFTFCIWIGMGVLAIHEWLNRFTKGLLPVGLAIGAVLMAPLLMGFQNFDDHTRRHLTGARDYASNFLESCDPNAIIFTYGDNDTYPLWYAQEVEGIRTDVRVVNLSLIAVDWYINSVRRKVNDSDAIKLSISRDAYRGSNRNILYHPQGADSRPMSLAAALQFMGEYHPLPSSSGREFQSYLPSRDLYFEVDPPRAIQSGWVSPEEGARIVSQMPFTISGGSLTKDELTILDILYSNMYDRPIYFSVTARESKLMGLGDFTRLEGLGLRFLPIKESGPRSQFGMHGNGGIDPDKILDRVTNKFRWGGFDKHDLFVTSSFMPTYYAIKTMIERAAYEFISRGENEKAVQLADKFFEGFPHMNFPYDARVLNLLRIYEQAGDYQTAKVHMNILADETEEFLRFYRSLSPQDLNRGFSQDQNTALQVVAELERLATTQNDTEYLNALKLRFDPFKSSRLPG